MNSTLTNPFPSRGRETLGNTPAQLINSPPEGVFGHADFIGPSLKALGLSSVRYQAVASSVAGLFPLGGPTTISRFVSTVVVNAVYGFPGRGFTHIREEIGEAEPSFTHADASSAPAEEIPVAWLQASLQDAKPSLMRFGVAHPVVRYDSKFCLHVESLHRGDRVSI